MDTAVIVRKVAHQMIAHRNKLAGKADDVQRAHAALQATATAVTEHQDEHTRSAATATSHWEGRSAAGFDRRSRRVTKSLAATAQSATSGATIVAATHASLDGGHKAVVRLIDEYTARATQLLDAARAVSGAGQRAALIKAVGQVVELVRDYTAESAKQLSSVQAQMKDAAKQLRALEREVEHDGYADPTRKRRRPAQGGKRGAAKGPKGGSKTKSGLRNRITKAARAALGVTEASSSSDSYGPSTPWCSKFATDMWRRAGVDIPTYWFTGDVYRWGQEHGLAYNAKNLDQVRPGDVLLFGTGPENTSTSTHIGIVESVHGDQVTLIEGNSGPNTDRVVRHTHTLSSATFYGGVHPS